MIECKAMGFCYTDTSDWVLRDVYARLDRGHVYHLRGANGSGKTTFLQILGHYSPQVTGGQLTGDVSFAIDPQDVLFLSSHESMDFVYDRVDQELYFGYRAAGFDHTHALKKVTDVLHTFHMPTWRHRDMASLSKGEKQFFRLVMMLATQRYACLCLDEPFAHMDETLKAVILSFIQAQMRTHPMAIVFADQHPKVWSEYFSIESIDLPKRNYLATSLWVESLPRALNIPGIKVELQDVGFRYPDQNLLFESIQTKIDPQTIVEIMGPNGSGKSTLVSLLLGDITPTQGTIAYHLDPTRVGMIDDPLSQFVYPTMIQELCAQGVRTRDYTAAHLYRSVVESHTAQQKVWMFQLVSLVKANLVLLDEPFAYLDEDNTRAMKEQMRLLTAQGKTVIYTTISTMKGLYDQQVVLA